MENWEYTRKSISYILVQLVKGVFIVSIFEILRIQKYNNFKDCFHVCMFEDL